MEIYSITSEWEDTKIIMGTFSSYEKALKCVINNVDNQMIKVHLPDKYDLEYNPNLIIGITEYWNKDGKLDGVKYHYEIEKNIIE